MKISLAISHTPWVPERVESLVGLLHSLDLGGRFLVNRAADAYRLFHDREPNHVWSARMWSWAAHETDADWCLFLQDDVEVAPDFWARLEQLIAECEGQIIGLESVHPATMDLAREGHRWCTTTDCLIGVGYVVRRDALADFVEWRSRLRRGAIEAISEDTLLGLFAARSQTKIWHPIPTIIDHLPMPSTYGNDHHRHRRPLVTWRDEFGRGGFDQAGNVPHLGRFYKSTAHLLRAWDPSFTAADFDRIEGDVCPERWRKWL